MKLRSKLNETTIFFSKIDFDIFSNSPSWHNQRATDDEPPYQRRYVKPHEHHYLQVQMGQGQIPSLVAQKLHTGQISPVPSGIKQGKHGTGTSCCATRMQIGNESAGRKVFPLRSSHGNLELRPGVKPGTRWSWQREKGGGGNGRKTR